MAEQTLNWDWERELHDTCQHVTTRLINLGTGRCERCASCGAILAAAVPNYEEGA